MDDNSQPQTELDRNEKRRKKHYEKKKEKRQAARAVARTESRGRPSPAPLSFAPDLLAVPR